MLSEAGETRPSPHTKARPVPAAAVFTEPQTGHSPMPKHRDGRTVWGLPRSRSSTKEQTARIRDDRGGTRDSFAECRKADARVQTCVVTHETGESNL